MMHPSRLPRSGPHRLDSGPAGLLQEANRPRRSGRTTSQRLGQGPQARAARQVRPLLTGLGSEGRLVAEAAAVGRPRVGVTAPAPAPALGPLTAGRPTARAPLPAVAVVTVPA